MRRAKGSLKKGGKGEASAEIRTFEAVLAAVVLVAAAFAGGAADDARYFPSRTKRRRRWWTTGPGSRPRRYYICVRRSGISASPGSWPRFLRHLALLYRQHLEDGVMILGGGFKTERKRDVLACRCQVLEEERKDSKKNSFDFFSQRTGPACLLVSHSSFIFSSLEPIRGLESPGYPSFPACAILFFLLRERNGDPQIYRFNGREKRKWIWDFLFVGEGKTCGRLEVEFRGADRSGLTHAALGSHANQFFFSSHNNLSDR